MKHLRAVRSSVWIARLLLGGTFLVSGWAKCTDIWGFVYKIEEYLAAWGIASQVPREFTLVGATALAMTEFCAGLLIATGCLRRTAAWLGAAIMAAMLPLSIYIYVADPVADCGCFGDLLVISNGATLAKNIVLAALAVFLLLYNRRATPGYRPGIQWLVLSLGIIYSLTVSALGWQLQPTVDFRPYPQGTNLAAMAQADTAAPEFIYEKGGESHRFSLDALPDSTWTYVGRTDVAAEAERPALFDDDGFDVSSEIFSEPGDVVLLTVPEPDYDYLMRARFANELARYGRSHGFTVVGAVAASGPSLEHWKSIARPDFEVYSAADTSLKELVRGPMGMVWIHDGVIRLKRNFSNIDPEFLSRPSPLESLWSVADGRLAAWLAAGLAAGLLLLWLLGKTLGSKPNPVKSVIKK